MEIKIEQIKIFSRDIVSAINRLLAQLNSNSKHLTDEESKEIIEGSSNRFFVARELNSDEIIGMLTLVVYRIPVWKKAWIEDLVVDKNYRNKGIATKLITHSIDIAKSEGVSSLNFTSSPRKESANKLYQGMGFERRDTNVYKIEL